MTKTMRKFRKFMRERGAWDAYKRAVRASSVNASGRVVGRPLNLKSIEEGFPEGAWLCDVFVWSRTPEGYDYWNELDQQWWSFIVAGIKESRK